VIPIKTVNIQEYANRVIEWNLLAHKEHDCSDGNIKNQLALVVEEYKELVDALNNKDAIGVVDGVCDLFVTAVYCEFLVNYEDMYSEKDYDLSWYGNTELKYDLGDTLRATSLAMAILVGDETLPAQDGGEVKTIGFIEDILIGCIDLMYILDVDINGAMEEVLDSNDSKMPLYDALDIPIYHIECESISEKEGIDVEWFRTEDRVIFRNAETGKVRKPMSFTAPELKQFIPNAYI